MIGLAALGISFITDMIRDKGEDLVTEAIKKTTGIDISGNKKITEEQKQTIINSQKSIDRELELIYKDKSDARSMNIKLQVSKDWLVRNAGSLIAIFVVVATFGLWLCMVLGITDNLNQNVLSSINSSLTLSLGYVLAFYFGSSKEAADSKRKVL